MKVDFTPNNPMLRVVIPAGKRHIRRMPFLYNITKTQIVDRHKLQANYNNSSRGYIVLPSATKDILSELNKYGIQYRAKVL